MQSGTWLWLVMGAGIIILFGILAVVIIYRSYYSRSRVQSGENGVCKFDSDCQTGLFCNEKTCRSRKKYEECSHIYKPEICRTMGCIWDPVVLGGSHHGNCHL